MTRFDACLLDAYDTIVYTNFARYRDELPRLAGIPAEAMYREFRRVAPALSVGQISIADAYADILRACGVQPRPDLVRALANKSRELLLRAGRLYDDVLPFLRAAKSRGVRIAIVSNCDENTRDLLVNLGVAALADALVLSNEVGAAKPAPKIYQLALGELGVIAPDAIFADNSAAYCAGATALGIRAVQVVRGAQEISGTADPAGTGDPAGATVVRSLAELEALL